MPFSTAAIRLPAGHALQGFSTVVNGLRLRGNGTWKHIYDGLYLAVYDQGWEESPTLAMIDRAIRKNRPECA
jgi:hypothetical protein